MVSNSWAHADENSSVYELKAYVENILKRLGLELHTLVVGNLSDDIYSTALTCEHQRWQETGYVRCNYQETAESF